MLKRFPVLRLTGLFLWLLSSGPIGLAQGVVIFNNHLSGSVITHVYLGGDHQTSGNGANDSPLGTQDWTGFAGLTGTGYTAQLWFALGANQPESSLQPVSPTTGFLTVAGGAGTLVSGGEIPLPGAPEGSIATMTLRVWDNRGGTITSWTMAQAVGDASGESPRFNSAPLGSGSGVPPTPLIGLLSFNIYQVPEPSALELASIGAAVLWGMRRRTPSRRRGEGPNCPRL